MSRLSPRIAVACVFLFHASCFASETVRLDSQFYADFATSPPSWLVARYGTMTLQSDSLRMKHEQGHPPSIGIPIESKTVAVSFRFRFNAGGTIVCRLEDGFDHHLCSLVLTEQSAKLQVHFPAKKPATENGAPRKRPRAEIVTLQEHRAAFQIGNWHDVELRCDETTFTAKVGEKITLVGTHEKLNIDKTGIIWAMPRSDVSIDDVRVELPGGAIAEKPAFSVDPKSEFVMVDDAEEFREHALGLFNDYVFPLLKTQCYECHSHESGEAEGGLVLDSRQGWKVGGALGPSVIPGKPNESWLLKAMTYEHDELEMPPDGRLAESDIAYVRRWIELGAPDPRGGKIAVADQHSPDAAKLWSVQPYNETPPARIEHDTWSRGRIDRYLLAQMYGAGLEPSDDAAPHTLLARLHYVLTGLVPKPKEVDSFEKKFAVDADTAIANVVDDLLDRPDFGIRWGRHWLDLARYADSPGTTRPTPYGQSWRYRNYVIDAFRNDKPFDEFVREQLAGDLLSATSSADRAENLIATGFIALGHVPGADRDVEKLTLDRIDEQLDVIGTTFLGVRIGCARCHDHKLDPFPTRDYYAIAGIFRSTSAGPAQRMASGLRPAGELPEIHDGPDWILANTKTRYHGAGEADEIRDEPIHLRGDTNLTGDIVPRGFPTLMSFDSAEVPDDASGRLQLTDWLLDESNVLVPRVIVNRVWHHVFGAGLVRTTDNFGLTGDPPSHPELLDDLAIRFRMQHGWKFKSLIREMLLSRAFRQASVSSQFSEATDPDNRLLWRANMRRMDAEALVDSIRDVVGTLDHSTAQRTVPNYRVGNQGSTLDLKIDAKVLAKRAIYWPVFRKDVPVAMDVLPIFNFPPATAPRGQREETYVPSQSLSLLNSPITLDAARALSKQTQAIKGDDATKLSFVYRRLFGRLPTPDEITATDEFLKRFRTELTGAKAAKPENVVSVSWNRLCHSLLVCNEFLVIE